MIRRGGTFLAIALCLGTAANAYVRLKGSTGTYFYRPDSPQVQILLNSDSIPGATNVHGQTWITPDSDFAGALRNAMNTWNSAPGSAAQFLPAQSTLLTAGAQGSTVLAAVDTPAVRSAFVAGMLANTANIYAIGGPSDGALLGATVYLNPDIQFSTTMVPNTYDLQAVLTHELGHVLGANHTGSIGGAMFQSTNVNSTAWRNLSQDDIAFAANVYPVAQTNGYGLISGTISLNGAPQRNALVNAVDTITGATFSALTNSVTGTYLIPAPASSYYIYTQPITGSINYNFYLYTTDAVDTGFQPAYLGGATPSILSVPADAVTNGDFSPSSGSPAIVLQYLNTASPGGFGDQSALFGIGAALPVPSGGKIDLIVVGPGIDATLTDENVALIGPLTLQPGTVRPDGYVLSNGLRFVRMTMNVAAVSQPTPATLILMKNGSMAPFASGLLLMPPPPM